MPETCPDCGHPATAHDPDGWEHDDITIDCQDCPTGTCTHRPAGDGVVAALTPAG